MAQMMKILMYLVITSDMKSLPDLLACSFWYGYLNILETSSISLTFYEAK